MRRALVLGALLALPACATAPAKRAEGDPQAIEEERIVAAFMELGAPEDKARCFGAWLTAGEADAAAEAAEIVTASDSRDDMKSRAMKASRSVRLAFISANIRCLAD